MSSGTLCFPQKQQIITQGMSEPLLFINFTVFSYFSLCQVSLRHIYLTPLLTHHITMLQNCLFPLFLLPSEAPLFDPPFLSSGHSPHLSLVLTVCFSHRLRLKGDRVFAVTAAPLWNNLPEKIRVVESVTSFKSPLKAYLYRCAFMLIILSTFVFLIHLYFPSYSLILSFLTGQWDALF